MKNLKESRWTMFRPDSREDALNTIDSLITDAIDLVAEIWDEIEDESILDKLQKLTDINDNIKMNVNEGLKLAESKNPNKKALKEYFEWSEGYEDVAEAKTLLKDMRFLASLDGLSDLEIMEAVKEEITKNYINNQGIGSHDDLDFDAFLDSVASEFMKLLHAPIIGGK